MVGESGLSQSWAGVEGDEDDGWSRHIEQAGGTLVAVSDGKEHLGPPPDDLFDVLGLAASSAPAPAALRALVRSTGHNRPDDLALMSSAARVGRAFLTLFNHAEVIEMVRSEFRGEPYWQRTAGICSRRVLTGSARRVCPPT